MIRFVYEYSVLKEYYIDKLFNCLDTKINILMEKDKILPNGDYYIFHIGKDTDRYQRVVLLDLIDICETDETDDLSTFGFKCIGYGYGYKIWKKI
jgi:hypothetical protein